MYTSYGPVEIYPARNLGKSYPSTSTLVRERSLREGLIWSLGLAPTGCGPGTNSFTFKGFVSSTGNRTLQRGDSEGERKGL